MPVRRTIAENDGLYFITITCARWFRLFELTNGYNLVYNWFDYLKEEGHFVAGYVIMPNHLHALLAFRNTGRSINKIIGNGKRFMAYDLVKKLQAMNELEILKSLGSFVNGTDKARGKLHEVFEPSFDWKECIGVNFIEQKLNYIHLNPCSGKWNLVKQPEDYQHSSALFYSTGEQGVYPVTSYVQLDDIDLTLRMDEI